MNFVKTKLALEEMEPGEILEVVLDSGEPLYNVSRSIQEEGHTLLQVHPAGSQFALYIQKC